MTQTHSIQFVKEKLALGTMHNDRIDSWLEQRGKGSHKYWVVIYRNWRDNTYAEYVAETYDNALRYVTEFPAGENLIFNPLPLGMKIPHRTIIPFKR